MTDTWYWVGWIRGCVKSTITNRQLGRVWCYPNLNGLRNTVNFLLDIPYYVLWNGWKFGAWFPIEFWWKLHVRRK